jgi:hypothetical protein
MLDDLDQQGVRGAPSAANAKLEMEILAAQIGRWLPKNQGFKLPLRP